MSTGRVPTARQDGPRLPRGGECQCVVCWRVFTSCSAFDAHLIRGTRQKPRSAEAPVECVHPSEVGLIVYDRAGGETWGAPGEETNRFAVAP